MKIVLSRSARKELTRAYARLELMGGQKSADRFLKAVERAVRHLSTFPHSGSPRLAHIPGLEGVRTVAISGFPYWIYYRVLGQKLRIERVLRDGVDLTTLLTPPDA